MIKVKLLSCTKDLEKVVASAISQCYASKSASEVFEKISEERKSKLIQKVISSGHHSTVEHASFTFSAEGVSRVLTHELVRHRMASYSQQSQRYVKFKDANFDYIIPPEIAKNEELKKEFEEKMTDLGGFYEKLIQAGIKPEDARFVLPNSTETKIVFTMNCRSLLNFFHLRMCTRAQWEIRSLATQVCQICKKEAPSIFKDAGPTCISEKICHEGSFSCGLWEKIPGAILR